MNSCLLILAARFEGRVLLRLDDVCDVLGIQKQTAYNQISAGSFPVAMRKEGKALVCDIRDLAEYLDRRREESKAA
ncbi:helix-turn-helix domain-containing protein [Cupriavidus sp. DB3]|uniref:helix-turn-helix transcriptional regulator n=1 Tax=Cupriavidus sp. DB3 TaxID=2873259 RepID=UPI001CF22033|nr:helix-turn-helix domain-containing protein [Cupriavidus sp. DB3]MCA7085814.1 helix-turn-helix domain-containing protein [Cupriavidus sp. DB3]